MPYTPDDRREPILEGTWPKDPKMGDLSFALCVPVLSFLLGKTLNSDLIGQVIAAFDGALEAFKEEVQRPYEEGKMNENGRIFHLDQIDAAVEASRGQDTTGGS